MTGRQLYIIHSKDFNTLSDKIIIKQIHKTNQYISAIMKLKTFSWKLQLYWWQKQVADNSFKLQKINEFQMWLLFCYWTKKLQNCKKFSFLKAGHNAIFKTLLKSHTL